MDLPERYGAAAVFRGGVAAARSVGGAGTKDGSRASSPSRYGRSGGDGIPAASKVLDERLSNDEGANGLLEVTWMGEIASLPSRSVAINFRSSDSCIGARPTYSTFTRVTPLP